MPALATSSFWSFYAYDLATPRLRVVTGTDFGATIPNTGGNYAMVDTELPYVSSNVYFLANTANQRDVWFHGYALPAG